MKENKIFEKEKQDTLPGEQYKLVDRLETIRDDYRDIDKLKGKAALITAGDGGTGKGAVVHFAREGLKGFEKDVPIGRPGQPPELGPAYVFLECRDSSYMTGQLLHINGGEIIGG